MEFKGKDQKQRKGFLAAIWESMTRTGGCCGSDGNCCGPSQLKDGEEEKKEEHNGRKERDAEK